MKKITKIRADVNKLKTESKRKATRTKADSFLWTKKLIWLQN